MSHFNPFALVALLISASLTAGHATPDDLYAVACDSIDASIGLQDFEFTAADGTVRLTNPESHTLSFEGLSCDPGDHFGRTATRFSSV